MFREMHVKKQRKPPQTFLLTSNPWFLILITFSDAEGRLKEGCEDVVCFMCRKGYFKYVDKLYRNNCVKKCPAGYEEANKRCRGT